MIEIPSAADVTRTDRKARARVVPDPWPLPNGVSDRTTLEPG